MKVRSSLLLAPVVAGLFLGGLAPAHAEPLAPVVISSATAMQALGTHDGTLLVTATWQASDGVQTYRVGIADDADGTPTPGAVTQDASATTVTLKETVLAPDTDYWVWVQPIRPSNGPVVTEAFHTPALDTVAPTGRFKLSATTSYIQGLLVAQTDEPTADFKVTQVAGDAAKSRAVVLGDGSPAKAWGLGSFTLSYTEAGDYTPHVILTDEYANTRDVALPTVHVRKDVSAPSLTLTKPSNPSKKTSWRVIRGTVSDAGVGVYFVGAYVLQKRAGIWWVYDFKTKKWLKGYSSWRKTESKSKANPWATIQPSSTSWHSSKIKGLTKGELRVEAAAIDNNFNVSQRHLSQKVR